MSNSLLTIIIFLPLVGCPGSVLLILTGAAFGPGLGLALAAVNLILIAITVPGISPRSGRSGNLILALLTFVVYYNLISLGQAWVAAGRVGMGAYLLALHGGVFVLAALWIAARHRAWSIAGLFSRSRASRLAMEHS